MQGVEHVPLEEQSMLFAAPGCRFPITLRSSSPILAASLHLLIILCLGLFVSDSEFLLLCFHFVPVYIFSFCAKFFFPHSWGFRLNCERNLSWERLCHDYLTTLFLVILTRILLVIAYRMSLLSSRSWYLSDETPFGSVDARMFVYDVRRP